MWECSYDKCKLPAVRLLGDCLLCDSHLCHLHLQKPWHKCPDMKDTENYYAEYPAAEKRHLEALCSRIDASNLCTHASMLRRGIPCQTKLDVQALRALMGGQNCHATILFDDKVEWLARFRLTWTSSPPSYVRDCILQSEVATLTYLRNHTSVPVPAIFDWRLESDSTNLVGIGYILMQKLEGEPVIWGALNPAQRTKVMQQLVDIYLELEKHPFEKVGSLTFSEASATGFDIQHLVSPSAFQAGAQRFLGPFPSPQEQWHSLLVHNKEMVRDGAIQAHHLVDLYTALEYRLQMLDQVWMDVGPGNQFYLKHPDDKGDHILVNQSFEIVGVIDWEWAQTVSRAEAFSSPCMMWPVASFYDGDNELSTDEIEFADMFEQRGRDDLALCVIQSRKVQRFLSLLVPEISLTDRTDVANLLRGLRDVLGTEAEWNLCQAKVLRALKADGLLAFMRSMDLETVSSS